MKMFHTLAFLIATTTASLAEPPKAVDPDTIKDKVRIMLGKEFAIEFKRDGDEILQPSESKAAKSDKAVVKIKFELTGASPFPPPRQGATRPFLHIDNHLDKTLQYKALARFKGSKEFFPVSEGLEPIPSGEGADKCWGFDEQVEEVVLYDFKLSDKPAK